MHVSRRFYESIGLIVLLGGLIWGAAYLISRTPAVLAIYANNYGPWSLAERIAGRLWVAMAATDRPVAMFIGGSSTWGSVDETVLSNELSGWVVLNAGAAQGVTVIPELQVTMLERFNISPDLLVLGLSPLTLRDMPVEIAGNGYGAFLDLCTGLLYLRDSIRSSSAAFTKDLIKNTLWPLHGHVRQIEREIRFRIWQLHRHYYWGKKLNIEEYSHFPEELQPTPRNYLTNDRPGIPASSIDLAETPSRWGRLFPHAAGPEEINRLRSLFSRALLRAKKVVVVVMPEHSVVRGKVLPHTIDPFFAVLAEFDGAGISAVDMREIVPDELMHDGFHIKPSGRNTFNHELAARLRPMLQTRR